MKKLVTSILGASLLLCCASTVFAADTYPPGPPYRSCPDTLTIFDIQQADTTIAPCHPAVLDNVYGIKGIIICFDPKPTGFSLNIQKSGGGPYSGVNVFTGSFNWAGAPFNLALGDSISVSGRAQEFPAANGMTEIEGFDGIQGTNDIIISKITSGNPLPLDIVTTTQLNWIPAAAGAEGEKWEGGLVRIRGPLRVARAGGGAGLFTNTFLLVKNSGPLSDSVMVDGNTLTTFAPPAVGTIIDSLQGVVNQGTTSGINSYRVQIRDGNDVFLSVPPNLVDAYPVEDNILRLEFDRNLDLPTAQNAANYSLASGIDGSTVDAAVVEGGAGRFVQLTITSVRTDGDIETVSAQGVASAGCPTCVISPPQARTFVNGVVDIKTLQAADPAMLSSFDDRSRYAGTGTAPGTKFTFRGVCTGVYAPLYYVQDENSGQRSGISVFAPVSPLVRGKKYRITGQIQEFDRETEVVNTVLITDEGAGAIPAATVASVAAMTDTTTDMTGTLETGEDYEGMLMKMSYVRVTEQRNVSQSWFSAGPAGSYADTILTSNLNSVLNGYTPPDSAMTITASGALHYASGRFRLCPRDPNDVLEHGLNVGVPGAGAAELSFSVAPNPAKVARISFTLPSAAVVDIGIFDLQGRKVAQVLKGSMPAGAHSREWNGRDASGHQVQAGVYFYRMSVNGKTLHQRGVLLN